MKEQIKSHEAKMQKTLDVLSKELAAVRAGRANPAVLDKITVEYYGAPTPLNQVAAISTPDPRTLAIQPWDGSVLKAIEKAIQVSDLGINPQNDGKQIRLRRQRLRSATSVAMHWRSSRPRRRRARSPRTSCTTARTRCRS